MPQLALNLEQITKARRTLVLQRDAQREANAQLKQAKTQLEEMQRNGADARATRRQRAMVEELSKKARTAAVTSSEGITAIKGWSDLLLRSRDPASMVEALSASHPVMLMPVAVQTRYSDDTSKLMIRIYPDAIHTFAHEPGLSPNEVIEGKRYWALRFADPRDAQSPWTQIARIYQPARAAWIVRSTTPTNVSQVGQRVQPIFDDAAIPLANPESQPVFATALPDRFVAIGFSAGKEIFRKWGGAVADLLPMSPLFDPLLVDDPEQHDPFGGDRAWMVNYDAALAAGMAIDITQSDLKAGAVMNGRIDRLVVLGVDWTQTPESAATLVATLLDNHHHSAGLKFVAQGTPTNNTGSARAGFAENGADLVAALQPESASARAAAVADELASAGARLQLLLGVPADVFDTGVIPGAELREGAAAGHMINALWNATIGYTLRWFWNPIDSAHSLIDDASIEQLRAFCMRFLRPSGPLAALRVGKQPYGILPVSSRSHQPQANSALERELLEAINWFRRFWEAAVARVPTLRDPSAESLHQVLAMQPWAKAKRFWEVVGPAARANYPDIEPFAFVQGLMLQLLIEDLLEAKPFSTRAAFLATCAVRPKAHALDAVPWVQRDPVLPKLELDGDAKLARNFIAALLGLLSQPTSNLRAPLTAMQNGESLLEAMLAFAADEEVLHSGRKLFNDHVQRLPGVSAELKLQAQRLRPAEYVGVDVTTQVGDQMTIGHANAVLGLKLVGTTGESSVEAFIGSKLGLDMLRMPEQMKNIASFAESLAFLKDSSAGELSHAFRTTLDLYAHRLDSWITSLATRRLDRMRESAPQGLHIGAFGVVEDLLPDSVRPVDQAADSLGYVHAPSLQQATTAAILRSGHVANRQLSGGAFDIDLRSRRVKRAKRLLEGLANGQSMAALIGYRFERGLRDSRLSQHILEFRMAFPLRPVGETAADEAQESIAARDVVDGVRLIDTYRKQGNAFVVTGVPMNNADVGPKVRAVLDDLLDQMDAVSDLLISESVYRMAAGNMDAAGAAMQTLDKQNRPPEIHVADTPHASRGYTQRVVVGMQSTDLGAWARLADDDIAGQVEPRLNAWLARLLGDPAKYVFAARVLKSEQDAQGRTRWVDANQALEVKLPELQLSPLSLVLQGEAQQGSGQSGVQEHLATLFGAQVRDLFGDAADQMAVALQADAPENGQVGLVAFESYTWLLRRLVEKTRALRRMDMVLARDGVETAATQDDGEFAGVDAGELEARLQLAEARAKTVLTELDTALPPAEMDADALAALDPNAQATRAMFAAVQVALVHAYALGWRSALASSSVAEHGTRAEAPQVLPIDSLPLAVARGRALLREINDRLNAAPPSVATDALALRVQAMLKRIRAILGKAFPVLPLFALGDYASEAKATLGDRKALLTGDDLAIAGWLPKLACVREATATLSDVLTASEAVGAKTGFESTAQDFALMQFPHGAAARWVALPQVPAKTLRGVVAVAAHAPAGLDATQPMAGLFVDEWSESIPFDRETTGLGFHFDAPGARAPQSILLAVPATPDAVNWTLDALIDSVQEAMSLARLRAVRPQDLQGLGLMLPGIFLSNNFKQDVPSVDFSKLLAKNLDLLRVAEGITASTAVMAAGKTSLSG